MKDINEYQEWTKTVWNMDREPSMNSIHALFGLATEVGEVTDLFKKPWFTPKRVNGQTEVDIEYLREEIGDVLYYLTILAAIYDIKMSDVTATNYGKLESRYGTGN